MTNIDRTRLAQLVRACQREGKALARLLARYRPAEVDTAEWQRLVDETPGAGTGGPPGERVREQILPRLALGIDESHKMSAPGAWAAAIVARAQDLWSEGPPPSARAVGNGVVWRALGLRGKPGENPDAVRAHFLRQLLGEAVDGDAAKMLRLLAAQTVGAPRGDSEALRDALVRQWLVSGSVEPESLADFAEAVRRAARVARQGRFGDRQVFIAAVWRQLQTGASLDEFKARLVEAHRAGLLELVRADLVNVMDGEEVAESEARHLEARYHFVVQEAP